MKISNRLEALTFFIHYQDKVVDVGTDHSLLPIYLIENDIVKHDVIASDAKKGPLEIAKKNVAMFELTDRIKLVLSDGLKSIDDEYDTVVIAGMGGSLINKILTDSLDKLKNVKKLILQPNNNEYVVRKFASENHFVITSEMVVHEDDHYYVIIVMEQGEADYQDLDLKYGPFLRREKPIMFMQMMNSKADKLLDIIKNYKNGNDSNLEFLKLQLQELEDVIDN